MNFSSLFRHTISARTAILIRTGNRPSFLARALASVAGQSDRDWCAMVLNDGERSAAESVVAPFAEKFPGRVQLQHFPRTGSASLVNLNFGLKNSRSEFIAIHDDDDSWEPNFLEESVAILRANPEAGGSVCQSYFVKEELVQGEIRFIEKKIYNEWQAHQVSLFRLAENLTFPPIALLARRAAVNSVGAFRARPELLGDWEFCLRLCASYPLAFVSRPLANYHHHGGNESLAGVKSTYEREGIEFRNQLLRDDLREGKAGLGFWVNISHAHGHIYGEIASLKSQLDRIESLLKERQKP